MWRKTAKRSDLHDLEAGGRLRQLVESGDTSELARRAMTLQSVLLDLHRQLASVQSLEELARTMGLALVGSFGCERLVVLRSDRDHRSFQAVAHRGDVPEPLLQAAPEIATRLLPFLPHVEPLVALPSLLLSALQPTLARCRELGLVRAAWLNVERQIDWVVLVGPKLTPREYDEFDRSMLQATFDAAWLACSRLLLVGALEERNRELSEANQRLLSIDDLKSAILTGVSHELRTPLTRIMSYTEAIRDTELTDDERRACADIVLGATEKLASHVDRALEFARLIGGRTNPKSARVSLHQCVEDVIVLGTADAGSRGIALEQHCTPMVALTDADYVHMILKNLVDNALKFSPRGGQVRVELFPEQDGATITVTDTGPGIPAEARTRIWRLFEHGDISLRRESEGLGLGLALAQRLALELGIELDLARTGPEGSVFRVHFATAMPAPVLPERWQASVAAPDALQPVHALRESGRRQH